MMRKLLVLLVTMAFSGVLLAQQTQAASTPAPDQPNFDLAATYSYMHSNLNNYGLGKAGLNGVSLQATRFFDGNVGITADVTYETGSDVQQSGVNVHRWTYLFGPTYAYRTSATLTPSLHVLFGADHERFSISNLVGEDTSNAFATALGGGIDARVGDRISIRLGQLDYIYTHRSGSSNNFRYTGGLVFKF